MGSITEGLTAFGKGIAARKEREAEERKGQQALELFTKAMESSKGIIEKGDVPISVGGKTNRLEDVVNAFGAATTLQTGDPVKGLDAAKNLFDFINKESPQEKEERKTGQELGKRGLND